MFTRRSFVAGMAATAVSKAMAAEAAPSVLPLWPNGPPGGGGPKGASRTSARGAVRNISVPQMEVWLPDRPNGAAVLVAAGGGYRRIELASEAWPAARWLNQRGIAAFVLSYRLPGEGWNAGPLAPLQDAQRSFRLLRARAERFGVDPKRIGALGFSAGGHLMGSAAARSEFRSYEPIDAIDDLSARPAFAALIYPVITLQAPYDQTNTRRMLVGDHPTAEAEAQWSVETHVTAHCPPVFLVQAIDDPVSNPANTVIMEKACERAGVPVELHRFPVGGHGFGMGRSGTPAAAWPGYFERWLSAIGG